MKHHRARRNIAAGMAARAGENAVLGGHAYEGFSAQALAALARQARRRCLRCLPGATRTARARFSSLPPRKRRNECKYRRGDVMGGVASLCSIKREIRADAYRAARTVRCYLPLRGLCAPGV